MGRADRPLSPFMQHRWLYSNTLSIVHRFTGILLSAGFLILVYWLVAAASGPERYAQALSRLASLPMQFVLASVLWSYCYHFLNGIRHLCWDIGLGFERGTARVSGWTVAVASVVLTGILWVVLQRSFGGAA